jgi:hypothetical protein
VTTRIVAGDWAIAVLVSTAISRAERTWYAISNLLKSIDDIEKSGYY